MKAPLDDIALPGTEARAVLEQLEPERLPRHVAIIMDGNGRWATARMLPRVEGHRAGIRAVRQTIETAARLDIDVVTLYAFSTENWKRPRHEVLTLMGLLKEYIKRELKTFLKHDLRFRPIGRIDQLDASVQRELQRAVDATAACSGPLIQIALNYSGRQELTDAVRTAVQDAAAGRVTPDDIDEGWIEDQLNTRGQPDPDLMIRTSGEQRISNFLLWQIAYSEIYFSPVLWPDFDPEELLRALLAYQQRERRFGGLPQSGGVFIPPKDEHGTT
ncbi:MAG: isoprenyl transferase [Thermoanaerobaculales bacterium]|nr:isoprenyl transferase [Thermoanaerobaculales bacterium]